MKDVCPYCKSGNVEIRILKTVGVVSVGLVKCRDCKKEYEALVVGNTAQSTPIGAWKDFDKNK